MKIEVIKEEFSVCKVNDYQGINLTDKYCFIGKTDEECSLVCMTENVPSFTIEREDGWKALRLQGILDFSLVGVLAKIATILAEHNISIFAGSTYNTDYVFMNTSQFEKALTLLKENDYIVE